MKDKLKGGLSLWCLYSEVVMHPVWTPQLNG